jgi:cellulose synthase/poly-beta-1,6-N-acetylglucosamine synthase-like glycosyltransferase
MGAAKVIFWASAGLLVYTHVGYGGVLALLARRRPPPSPAEPPADEDLPRVAIIVAAYAEEAVIAERVSNLRALDYPVGRRRIIVACDGSPDATAQRARAAGADLVLELPRGGKVRAQDAAVAACDESIVAFSDANARWEPGALRELVAALTRPGVGYVCGQVSFVNERGDNQEGLYWRYEMALRSLESRVRSVTGGNGAIYATRRESYVIVDPIMGHDLSFPFNLVKRGWRAIYAPGARASEKMVPSIEGEFRRKRRMMSHGWPIMLQGGMLSPRGYDPVYGLMLFSHRVLRYLSPFLHLALAAATLPLLDDGGLYVLAGLGQAALVVAALLAGRRPNRASLVARYYVLTTASLAAGLWDWLTEGTRAGWEPAEGTR